MQGVRIIRPLLMTNRAGTQAICNAHAWEPARDYTNELTGPKAPLRSRVRNELSPIVLSLFPSAREASVRTARSQSQIASLLKHRARAALNNHLHDRVPIDALRSLDDASLHTALRLLVARATSSRKLDRLSARTIERVIARIRSKSDHAATFDLAASRLIITRTHVLVQPFDAGEAATNNPAD
jgi:tRNA(Ile)-lysidine synthase TilS/MesJ